MDETEKQLRKSIYDDIMAESSLIEEAKELGSDAYLVAHRTRMACAIIALGLDTK
jgi:hypothetical protein